MLHDSIIYGLISMMCLVADRHIVPERLRDESVTGVDHSLES